MSEESIGKIMAQFEVSGSGKNSSGDVVEINLVQVARYFYSNRWILLASIILFPLVIGFWKTIVNRPVYRSEIHLLLDLQNEENQFRNPQSFFMTETESTAKKLELIEKYYESRDFAKMLDDVLQGQENVAGLSEDEIAKVEPLFEKMEADDLRADFALGLVEFRINVEKFRIELATRYKNAEVSAAVANVVGYSLVEFNRRMLLRRVNSVKKFLLNQTEKTKAELTQLEKEMVELQARLKVVSPDEMRNRVNYFQVEQYSKFVDLQRELNAAQALVEESAKQLKSLKGQLATGADVSSSYVEQLQKRLEVLKYQRSQLEDVQTSQEMKQKLDQDIISIQAQLGKSMKGKDPVGTSLWTFIKKLETDLFELEQKRTRLKMEMQAAEKANQTWKKGFDNLPENLRMINDVKRRIELTTGLFTTLQSKLQETEIREAAQLNDLIVISPAEIPRVPYGMSLGRSLILALAMGAFFATLILGLKFALVPTIRDASDLEKQQISLLGQLPWFQGSGQGFLAFSQSFPLLANLAPVGPASSALRLIRFKLERLLSLGDRRSLGEGKVLAVLGPNAGAGRSFFTVNLADLLSRANYKVLILSFDFRKRGAKDFFKSKMAKTERVPLTHFKFFHSAITENLHVVESEPILRNWSDDLEGPEFRETFQRWKKEYDLIIIDTPPMKGSIEPLISAQYADAVILIVNQRTTLREDLEQQLKHLRDSLSVSIFGVVNAVYDEVGFQSGQAAKEESQDEAA